MHLLKLILLTLITGCCIGQEGPSITTLPLSHHESSYHSNYCERSKEVDTGKRQLKDGLRGLNVKTALIEYQLNQNGIIDENNPPIAVNFMDEIAKRAGFEWRSTFGILKEPGENETYDDVLNLGVKNYDVICEWFRTTQKRLNDGFIYTERWYDASIIMIWLKNGQDGSKLNIWTSLQPVTAGVWGLILFTIFFSGMAYQLILKLDDRSESQVKRQSLQESTFQTAYLFTGQNLFKPKTGGAKIIVCSLAFLFVLTVNIYTSNMTKYLIVEERPTVTIKDVDAAIKLEKSFCVWRGTPSYRYFKTRFPKYEKMVNVEGEKECFDAVLNNKCDVCLTTIATWRSFKGNKDHNPSCKLEHVGEVLDDQLAGFVLRSSATNCVSFLRDVLTLYMVEMKIDGTYNKIWDTYVYKTRTNDCLVNGDSNDEYSKEMDAIHKVGGMFILHGITMVIALFISLFVCMRQPPEVRASMKQELFSAATLRGPSLRRITWEVAERNSEANPEITEHNISNSHHILKEIIAGVSTEIARLDEVIAMIKKKESQVDVLKKKN